MEKSLPAREETLIEVEMTSVQKQYYRAVFERNVDFLAGKDGNKKNLASLMNVAMQLRKVCNVSGARHTSHAGGQQWSAWTLAL